MGRRTQPEFVEEYKVTLPQNAARVLEWLAQFAGKSPEAYIESTLHDHLHGALTQLDDKEAEDILLNRGMPGEWDWKNSVRSRLQEAR